MPISVEWLGRRLEDAYRLDLLVADCVLVECKAVIKLHEVHRRQVLTYLQATDLQLGFLLNFGGAYMRTGIQRVVNDPKATRRWLYDKGAP